MKLLPLAARISAGLTARSAVSCKLALRVQESLSTFNPQVHGRRGQQTAAEADGDEITIEVSANDTSIAFCCQSRSWSRYGLRKRERVVGNIQLEKRYAAKSSPLELPTV